MPSGPRSDHPSADRGVGRSATTTATRDNLALAPQSQPMQRVPSSTPVADDERRPQITTPHPTTYNEARQIGERFRDGSPVIMNLTEMDEADAKRLVDFAAGLAFGLRGTIERVTNRVFLLTGQRPGHRRGQGQDRRGRIPEPEPRSMYARAGLPRDLDCRVFCLVLQVVYLVLFVFNLVLLTRFVLGQVLSMSRRWQPVRGRAAALGWCERH